MTLLPSEVILLLGGYRAVSRRISRPYTTVASWAARQAIPPKFWSQLVEFAAEKGTPSITYESLAKAHAARKDAPPPQPAEAAP
jgi:hypothetical protein